MNKRSDETQIHRVLARAQFKSGCAELGECAAKEDPSGKQLVTSGQALLVKGRDKSV